MNIVVWNCLKLQRKKKFFFSLIFSLLRYPLTVFLPPLPKVGCPMFVEIQNPWGKVMERSGLTFEHFSLEVVENRRAKKSFFCCCWFCLGPPSYGIGATIRIGREMLCLPYAGFFQGLSFALRSHDLFKACHWSSLPHTKTVVNQTTCCLI